MSLAKLYFLRIRWFCYFKNLLSFPSCFITANSYVIAYQEASAMARIGWICNLLYKIIMLLNVFQDSKCIASIQSSVSNIFVNLLMFFSVLHSA